MVSSWSSGRAALVARSRFYLAVVATGGMAVGGALTVAVADVPTTTQAQPQPTTPHRAARHAAPSRGATSPVRPAHRRAASPPAATHAS